MDAIEIGLFQLENLVLTRSPFVFLNLALDELETEDVKLRSYVQTAVKVHPDRVEDYLVAQKISTDSPIVLLCQDSQVSRRWSNDLEKKGFRNVYVIENGFQGLVAEARSFLGPKK